MKNVNVSIFFVIVLSIYSCTQNVKPQVIIPKDTTITNENAFSKLKMDSAMLERFIIDETLPDSLAIFVRNFYYSRNFHFAWFNGSGLTEPALAFWNLHNSFIDYTRDSAIVDKTLHSSMKSLVEGDTSYTPDSKLISHLELQLTTHFYEYAHYAYTGRIDPLVLLWHIPRKKVNALALLDTIMAHEGRNIEELEPLNVSYRLLKKKLLQYYNIEKQGGWQLISKELTRYRTGDSSELITQIKRRLLVCGDYDGVDTSKVFNPELALAVKATQKRFGLKSDGIIRNDLVHELNVPINNRIEQMLINLERMRWLPKESAGRHIVANIPEFKLHVFDGSRQVFDMDIVVGQVGHRTVIFTDSLKYIVFSPYWNIPRSIVRNEIVPAMNKDAHYLKKKSMEQTGFINGLPVIRQRPGGNNALGRVKFIFPNNYSIYFHDTPAKSLFKKQRRAFSHGCVRLEEPKKLAVYLLRENPEWTTEKIQHAMHAGKGNWVTLERPVPVSLLYFTAWVDDSGMLNFRKDIYGHDERMAEQLFGSE